MECLGDGPGLGTDEQGCDTEVEPSDFPKLSSTQEEDTKEDMYPERNLDGDSEIIKVVDKTQEKDSESDLLALLKERAEEEAQVDRQQPQTHRELAVTPTPIEWPCGGLLQTFYGTFCPPAIRGPPLFCVWTLDPQDSRPLRLDLQQLVLGPGDRLTVYNREQGKGDVIKIVS